MSLLKIKNRKASDNNILIGHRGSSKSANGLCSGKYLIITRAAIVAAACLVVSCCVGACQVHHYLRLHEWKSSTNCIHDKVNIRPCMWPKWPASNYASLSDETADTAGITYANPNLDVTLHNFNFKFGDVTIRYFMFSVFRQEQRGQLISTSLCILYTQITKFATI